MFKNDRMMTILTGLVLAIFAGTMVQYGDRIMALMSGESETATQNDSYSVRAGAHQVLDVLSNDTIQGPIIVLTSPACGAVELTGNNKLSYSSADACSGEVEFAYCVDADGACEPNSVKINVISVNFAQAPSSAPATQPAETGTQTASVADRPVETPVEENAVASDPVPVTVAQAPAPVVQFEEAPQIESVTAIMMPPTLAAPSIPELVSPSIAMASIRQSAGGLNRTSNTDQNIETQNSAGVTQAASVDASVFQAPEIGESSNISIGGSSQTVIANVAAPSGLRSATNSDANVAPLERGPVALAAMAEGPRLLAPQETAPLSANPERSSFEPVEIAAVQNEPATPDARFNTVPREWAGPIALIALQGARTDGNAAGESLNITLAEPGEQSFARAMVPPLALAPTSDRPTEVTVLEREPNTLNNAPATVELPSSASASTLITRFQDVSVGQTPFIQPITQIEDATRVRITAGIAASVPNQVMAPSGMVVNDTSARFVSVSSQIDQPSRAADLAAPDAPVDLASNNLPSVNLTPADRPVIELASLPVVPEAPIETAPAQNSTCEILLGTRATSGANIELDIFADCKPTEMVTVTHAGLSFSVLTDSQGAVRTSFPALEADAEVSVLFDDGTNASANVIVNDIDSFLRAGVSWQSAINLDLNAFEYGAAAGTDGHVSPEAPRDYRSSRIKGGGYLIQLGDPALENGAMTEIYTIPVNRNQQRGTVSLSVFINDAASICGQEVIAKTSRSREGRSASERNVRFDVPACGTIAGQIALPNAINDIRLAGR